MVFARMRAQQAERAERRRNLQAERQNVRAREASLHGIRDGERRRRAASVRALPARVVDVTRERAASQGGASQTPPGRWSRDGERRRHFTPPDHLQAYVMRRMLRETGEEGTLTLDVVAKCEKTLVV